MLRYDWKRAVQARWIYLSIFLTTAFLTASQLDKVAAVFREGKALPGGWTGQFVQESMLGDWALFFLPVLCALPYASCFVDEVKSQTVKMALVRVNRSAYLRSKAVTAAAAGGGIVTVGAAAFLCASLLVFLPLEEGDAVRTVTAEASGYGKILVRYFCFGALGAETGLWISTLVNNRYMAWLSPFMIQYLLMILCERYIPWCQVLYPVQWLDPSGGWPLEGWTAPLWMICLTAAAGLGFFRAAERRLDRG